MTYDDEIKYWRACYVTNKTTKTTYQPSMLKIHYENITSKQKEKNMNMSMG